tara:strand:- start:3513 stop:4166 length:654 start_codon:yes stop_codon:yes gene_type:complete
LANARIIKRYANRKLYDTQDSRYVTLDQIAELVQQGDDVQIIDKDSGEDITGVTLAQIVLEAEKQNRRLLPISSLKVLVQSGGMFLQRRIAQPVQTIRDDAEERMTRLRSDAEQKIRSIKGRANLDEVRDALTDMFAQTQQSLEELQSRIEERYNQIVPTGLGNKKSDEDGDEVIPEEAVTMGSVELELTERVRVLEQRLVELEARLSAQTESKSVE